MTLEDALQLLSLPRIVGTDPEGGEEITAQNGRYGPYLKKGTDSRSLTSEDQLFTVTLDEALAIYAQPKQRGRRAARHRRCVSWAPTPRRARDGDQGRPVRAVRHRRRDQRRCARATASRDHRRAGRRAARRAPGPRPGNPEKKAAKKTPAKKTAAKKS